MIRTMPSHDVSWQHLDSYRQERDIFMDHSKKSMANVIARYMKC